MSVLAYYFVALGHPVHTLRLQLKAQGIDDAWGTLRNTLSSQVRITTTVQHLDGRTVHVRKVGRPEPLSQFVDLLQLRSAKWQRWVRVQQGSTAQCFLGRVQTT